MEEKKYPAIEEEDGYGCLPAEDPAVAYASSPSTTPITEHMPFDYPADYDPGIGPYSIKELNERIDRVEADSKNPDKWIRVDDFWSAMQKEHLWLQ